MYDNCKIYGPYVRKDKRKFVVIIYPNGQRTTTLYSRYLVERKLNRYITSNEDVHHIDGDFTNDSLSNLEVVLQKSHLKQHNPLLEKSFVCPHCRKTFTLKGNRYSWHKANKKRRPNMTGPFCNKSCAEKYQHNLSLH